ncbi:hypothetical protein EJB05_11722 [Eragrostis curvula]|uniref:Uncharacterized protein n=2 Tax=Eragrostis curvula TaxID=38414 RepID=A0A5J9VQ73_9POAL|nr:hypothetical protein EJB05_11722 [Eragrostis curvula]
MAKKFREKVRSSDCTGKEIVSSEFRTIIAEMQDEFLGSVAGSPVVMMPEWFKVSGKYWNMFLFEVDDLHTSEYCQVETSKDDDTRSSSLVAITEHSYELRRDGYMLFKLLNHYSTISKDILCPGATPERMVSV